MGDRSDAPRPRRGPAPNQAPRTTEISAGGEAVLRSVALPPPAAPPRERVPESAAKARQDGAVPVADRALDAVATTAARLLTVEHVLYGVILLLAFSTRFWDLGSRALHHDESLHAYYSWKYVEGDGYTHHPLMHGPLLFHLIALAYLVVGDTDATTRYMTALFGVALVGLPWLLRGPRHLGRWGALAASALLLVSPSTLYYSRNLRHDMFTLTLTLLLFICIVRYLESPQRKWLITGAAVTGPLLANHEIIFAILVIFFGFLYASLMFDRLRHWLKVRPQAAYAVIGVHAAGIVAALGWLLLTPASWRHEALDIPWENPTRAQEQAYYRALIQNPLVVGILLIAFGFVVALKLAIDRARDPERAEEGWLNPLISDSPGGSVGSALRAAWADRLGVVIAFVVAATLFVGLFTSMLTNLRGLWTSTFATNGTLLYWLGQHDFRRGDQPWFYYLLLLPQYEYLAVMLGVAAIVVTLVRSVGSLARKVEPGTNLQFRLFLVAWAVLIFAGLSYAGEKMPWLVIHIALPFTILAATVIGGLVERGIVAARAARERGSTTPAVGWPEWGSLAALLLTGAAFLALAARLTEGPIIDGRRTLDPGAADNWWWLALPPLAALVVVAASFVWRGPRRAGQAALAAAVVGFALLQIHAGWRMSYLEGDVPKDMLVYTQTSPDVARMMNELDQFSYELTGGKDLEVWYDDKTSWPLQWYLRDYPNKHYFGASISGPPGDAAVVIVSNDRLGGVETYLSGYTRQEYVLRWWFPENETYRNFAIAPELTPGLSAWKTADQPHGPLSVLGSIVDSVETQFTPAGQQRLYRLIMYRDLPGTIGQFNYNVYVRNDLLPFFNGIRY
ncbi:MAG: flippase activity-associated protein Agl23 [Thermomicrobiales bacterium]